MSRKNILITNDDGINGEGLVALEKSLSEVANVFVLAPDSNRSAVSSHLNMNVALKFVECGKNRLSCSGSPVDCVIAALKSDLFEEGLKFDAIFSGINKGANLGTDVVYSGTCAAARQAVLYKVPGIAVSLECFDESWKFSALAEFCAKNLEKLISLSTSELFVSVNAYSSDKYNEVVYSSLGVRDYRDSVDIIEAPDGNRYGFFKGGNIQSSESPRKLKNEASDYAVVNDGKISISRIFAEPYYEHCPADLKLSFSF